MKSFTKNSLIIAGVVASVLGLAQLGSAATTVSLGTAADFAVLAGSAITGTNTNIVTGNAGLSPTGGTAITLLTCAEMTGVSAIYDTNAGYTGGGGGSTTCLVTDAGVLTTAKNDLVTAYGNAALQPTDTAVTSDLGTFLGGTLTPGVYEDNDAPNSLGLTGTLTLDAQGDADAVFIFKTAGTLTTASGAQVVLINGAQACNVFWQVGASATLGTGSLFKGNILAMTSITDNGGSTVEGRFLATVGAVTLDNTTITKATCVAPPPSPSPSPPPPSPAPAVSPGGSFFPPPLINVTKIPSPLDLPGGPGLVTYNYTVSNIGIAPMSNITVIDDKCVPTVFVSGDSNSDSNLDVGEAWEYSCTKTVSQTETNTAIAHGVYNSFDAYDSANATVVVGAPIIPPLIHVVKRPSAFVLPVGGGVVTYLYAVTNPGTEPLSNVSIIDDKCTGLPGRVVGHPGDLNKNNLLESNETWSFTCQTNLTQTTTNIGTAEGHANGLTAIDFSPATVVVLTPGFPNTGLPPIATSTWVGIALSGLFGAAFLFYIDRRKHIV